MQIFIYEFITGGGLLTHTHWGEPTGSLLTEGRAMVVAAASDFASVPNVNVVAMNDTRVGLPPIPNVRFHPVASADAANQCFAELANEADMTLIIAPEIDDVLVHCCQSVQDAGGKLIGTEIEFARLASDKLATTNQLSNAGVEVPNSVIAASADQIDWPGPFVIKPRLGAGSVGVQLVDSLNDIADSERTRAFCIERFVPGRAASVTVIRGPNSHVVLPPCWQTFANDSFEYLGGALIDDSAFIERARRLAELAIDAIPTSTGYFGVDMILGVTDDGSNDAVIEVNPRLTTSYVGLREAIPINLADVMLRIFDGKTVAIPAVQLNTRFEANGRLDTRPATRRSS